MSKHGETEKFIEKLFKEKGEFVFGGEKLNIVKIIYYTIKLKN